MVVIPCQGTASRGCTLTGLSEGRRSHSVFTPNNGATRLVPGTHRLVTPPPKKMAAPASGHPDQTLIVAKAGSALVFNGHLWHSGTRNETNRPRRVLQCQFVARDLIPPTHRGPNLPERLGQAARYILGGGA
ncbi:MAG: hypothetical protein DMG06_20630 [Acidobacteria bacterium]|nr:MAG: hypothetical protein DMG06_20630 [Acidobacteriota bacterium]